MLNQNCYYMTKYCAIFQTDSWACCGSGGTGRRGPASFFCPEFPLDTGSEWVFVNFNPNKRCTAVRGFSSATVVTVDLRASWPSEGGASTRLVESASTKGLALGARIKRSVNNQNTRERKDYRYELQKSIANRFGGVGNFRSNSTGMPD